MNLIYTKTLLFLMSYAASGVEFGKNDLNDVSDQAHDEEKNKSCELYDNMAGSLRRSSDLRIQNIWEPLAKTENARSSVLEYIKNLTGSFCANSNLSKAELEKYKDERLLELIKCMQGLTLIFVMVVIRKRVIPAMARDLMLDPNEEAESPDSDDDADNQEMADENGEVKRD